MWAARISQAFLLCFILFWIIGIYSFFFPFDSEFEQEFENLTGLSFPASGEIVKGKESGLDLGGDYFVDARVKVDAADYQRLLHSLHADPTFQTNVSSQDTTVVGNALCTSCDRSALIKPCTFSKNDISKGEYQSISFLPDHRTIIFHRRQE
ncbi:hypothetical protein [Hymenobacter sp. BT730]|uniref:hypothetical protein n=1 Tax=Hymenobacter sp. BT730 TaxID=3063332 RepID=UPI0026DFE05A|nr:hypothetical protein [Hymenobacter sp. BT730]